LDININSIVLYHISGIDNSLNQVYDKFLNDFIKNNWDCIMKIGPTKYIYNISNICYNILNIDITKKTSYLNLLKKIGKKGGKTIRNISNEILELTTRTVVSVQTILDIIVKNEKENNKSKYNEAPKSIKDGLSSAYKSIKNIKNISNNDKTISQKILLPIASITEATSQTLIGIQSTINKKKITINENRYK